MRYGPTSGRSERERERGGRETVVSLLQPQRAGEQRLTAGLTDWFVCVGLLLPADGEGLLEARALGAADLRGGRGAAEARDGEGRELWGGGVIGSNNSLVKICDCVCVVCIARNTMYSKPK